MKIVKIKRLEGVKNNRREPLLLCLNDLQKIIARLESLTRKMEEGSIRQERMDRLASDARLLYLSTRDVYKTRF